MRRKKCSKQSSRQHPAMVGKSNSDFFSRKKRGIFLYSAWSDQNLRFGAKISGVECGPSVSRVFAIMFPEWKFLTGTRIICISWVQVMVFPGLWVGR